MIKPQHPPDRPCRADSRLCDQGDLPRSLYEKVTSRIRFHPWRIPPDVDLIVLNHYLFVVLLLVGSIRISLSMLILGGGGYGDMEIAVGVDADNRSESDLLGACCA